MEIGKTVKLKQPVVQGVIIDTEYDKGAKELKHLVELKDEEGDPKPVWFLESQLELQDD
jgi:hypothetical protein